MCWAIPVYQQLTGDPGKLTLLARSGGEPGGRGGLVAVRATLWRTLGVPPTFAQGEPDPLHFASISFFPAGWPQSVQTLAVFALLVWLFVVAVRRRDHLVVTLMAVGGALIAGMVATAYTIPLDRGLVAGYTFRWFTIASFVVWFGAGLAIVRLFLLPARHSRPGARSPEPASSDAADGEPTSAVDRLPTAWVGAIVAGSVAARPGQRHAAVEGPVRLLLPTWS